VTCARGGTLPNSIWYIEQNTHPRFPADAEKVNYRIPGFLARFWELNKVMWRTNAGLVESHAWDSRPGDWPWLRRGINFWFGLYRRRSNGQGQRSSTGLSHWQSGNLVDHHDCYRVLPCHQRTQCPPLATRLQRLHKW
jgi:hypothetical protein